MVAVWWEDREREVVGGRGWGWWVVEQVAVGRVVGLAPRAQKRRQIEGRSAGKGEQYAKRAKRQAEESEGNM